MPLVLIAAIGGLGAGWYLADSAMSTAVKVGAGAVGGFLLAKHWGR